MSSGTSTPTKAPKTMSSRLLTMKFMQRAATAPSPTSTIPDQPSSKRHKAGTTAPTEFAVESLTDRRAVQAALAEEEAKRQSALDRQAIEAGDTRWVLRFEDEKRSSHSSGAMLHVVQAGFSAIDGLQEGLASNPIEEQNIDRPSVVGRRSFGRFNRAIEKLQDPTVGGSSDSDSDSEKDSESGSDGSSSDDPASILVKTERENALRKMKLERKAKRKAGQAESPRSAEKRNKKEVKLNSLQSISSGSTPKNQACHACGEVGHFMANCPKRNKYRNDSGGHPRKPN